MSSNSINPGDNSKNIEELKKLARLRQQKIKQDLAKAREKLDKGKNSENSSDKTKLSAGQNNSNLGAPNLDQEINIEDINNSGSTDRNKAFKLHQVNTDKQGQKHILTALAKTATKNNDETTLKKILNNETLNADKNKDLKQEIVKTCIDHLEKTNQYDSLFNVFKVLSQHETQTIKPEQLDHYLSAYGKEIRKDIHKEDEASLLDNFTKYKTTLNKAGFQTDARLKELITSSAKLKDTKFLKIFLKLHQADSPLPHLESAFKATIKSNNKAALRELVKVNPDFEQPLLAIYQEQLQQQNYNSFITKTNNLSQSYQEHILNMPDDEVEGFIKSTVSKGLIDNLDLDYINKNIDLENYLPDIQLKEFVLDNQSIEADNKATEQKYDELFQNNPTLKPFLPMVLAVIKARNQEHNYQDLESFFKLTLDIINGNNDGVETFLTKNLKNIDKSKNKNFYLKLMALAIKASNTETLDRLFNLNIINTQELFNKPLSVKDNNIRNFFKLADDSMQEHLVERFILEAENTKNDIHLRLYETAYNSKTDTILNSLLNKNIFPHSVDQDYGKTFQLLNVSLEQNKTKVFTKVLHALNYEDTCKLLNIKTRESGNRLTHIAAEKLNSQALQEIVNVIDKFKKLDESEQKLSSSLNKLNHEGKSSIDILFKQLNNNNNSDEQNQINILKFKDFLADANGKGLIDLYKADLDGNNLYEKAALSNNYDLFTIFTESIQIDQSKLGYEPPKKQNLLGKTAQTAKNVFGKKSTENLKKDIYIHKLAKNPNFTNSNILDQILGENKELVNLDGENGNTPWMYTIANGKSAPNILSMLAVYRQYGADFRAHNDESKTFENFVSNNNNLTAEQKLRLKKIV